MVERGLLRLRHAQTRMRVRQGTQAREAGSIARAGHARPGQSRRSSGAARGPAGARPRHRPRTRRCETAAVSEDSPPLVTHRAAGTEETRAANRSWWDSEAEHYQGMHGSFLGDADFLWCPEGLRESEAGLLGPVAGRRVLEVGCGAGQCGRWLRAQGAEAVGIDLSMAQLRISQALDARSGTRLPVAVADALALPFAEASFDVACSAYGAVPFVADPAALMREVARVLRPGGRWVFATTHPLRWALPDDPGPAGLVVRHSYFDRTPYVEQDEAGRARYVEHHRTMSDRVRDIVAAGLVLADLLEPEWPEELRRVWGGWSPTRGRLVPGTAIFVCHKPASARPAPRRAPPRR